MMNNFEKNLSFFKENNEYLFNKIKNIESSNNFVFNENKDNVESDNICIHSVRDPKRESEKILMFNEIEKYDSVVIIGNGLGYLSDIVFERYPDKNIFIFELEEEIFNKFLEKKNISKSYLSRIKILDFYKKEKDIEIFLNKLNEFHLGKTLILHLPSYDNLYLDRIEFIYNKWREFIKNYKNSFFTNKRFQRRWINNGILNFKHVLNTPNIIKNNFLKFKDYKAIVVAAGPSLNFEIENLKKIKENKSAFIFSIGSAINTLVKNDIYPDFAVTYDPQGVNRKAFDILGNKNINSIPLLFGSSVGYETVDNYPGEKYHFLINQDRNSLFLLNDVNKNEIIFDSPTVALITLQILYKIGFEKIYLVGQNLAHLNEKSYSEGIDYYEKRNINKNQLIETIDVKGDKIKTEKSFINFKEAIENFIKQVNDKVRFINTTKGGAKIEGTEFKELEKVMEEELTENNHDISLFDLSDNDYDPDFIYDRFLELKKYKEAILEEIDKAKEIIKNIDLMAERRNFKQNRINYKKFDESFNLILDNIFYKTILGPMNRIEFNILSKRNKTNRDVSDQYTRAKNMVKNFNMYLDSLRKDYILLEPIFKDLKDTVVQYKNNSL
jgi:hypothetical protein